MTIDIKNIAASVTASIIILSAIGYFVEPIIDNKIKEISKGYTESAEFKEYLNNYLLSTNSNNMSLRKLLADKMDIDEDEVASKIAEMYNKDKKRLLNLLRTVNLEHPEYSVWTINE